VSSQDRLAFEIAGDDKTKFRAAKKMNLEDVYKQIWLMNEKAELRKAQQQE
jgi:hypothetical protein